MRGSTHQNAEKLPEKRWEDQGTDASGRTRKQRRRITGAVLAAVIFLICSIWYSWRSGLVFAGLFLAAGFLDIRVSRPWMGFLLNALWGAACIFVSGWIPTRMTAETGYLEIGYYRILMNFLCAAVIYGVCLAAAGDVKRAILAASGILLLLATVNDFVFQFRGNLLKPLDFLAANTAMNVLGQYGLRIREGMVYSWIWWLWMMFWLGALPSPDGFLPRLWLRVAALAATVLCAAVLGYGIRDIRTYTWSNEGVTRNGYLLNFTVSLRDCFVEKPEGYSAEAIHALEEAYAMETGVPERQEKPNIIVIMNESYANFEVLGSSLRTNRTVTPFADSLRENTIRGYALTSVFGGTTANAEFEFLTGFSMANVPEGACPYQQYIQEDMFSLAHVLKQEGYNTFATHPYFSSGWNRTKVYPHLGFDVMTFDEDYPYQDLIREFVSDREMYAYLLEKLKDAQEEPLFLFGITMQNHGDYIYNGENYGQTVFLEDYEAEYPMAEQYLTLLHESDKAMETFFTALQDWPEDTIVLFFGDHFPQVEGDFFLDVHGGEFATLSEQQLQYTVPFFLWANYDIPEQEVPCTSLNYLGRYLLENAGLELPPYYRFLAEMEAVIPALNAAGYYSNAQQTYLPFDAAEGEEAQWLNRYAIVQYNGMFEKKHRSEIFWESFLS